MSSDRPHEIRLGRIKAAIWRNESDSGTWFSVTISRIFKTDAGWDTSNSFSRDELPLVAKVADMAHSWIYQHGNEREDSESTERERKSSRQRETPRSK